MPDLLFSVTYTDSCCLMQVGKLKDSARSVSRTIQSNFFDAVKQEAIELLLMGDFFREEYADKGKMLMDQSALLGKASVNPSCSFLAARYKQLHPLENKNKSVNKLLQPEVVLETLLSNDHSTILSLNSSVLISYILSWTSAYVCSLIMISPDSLEELGQKERF